MGSDELDNADVSLTPVSIGHGISRVGRVVTQQKLHVLFPTGASIQHRYIRCLNKLLVGYILVIKLVHKCGKTHQVLLCISNRYKMTVILIMYHCWLPSPCPVTLCILSSQVCFTQLYRYLSSIGLNGYLTLLYVLVSLLQDCQLINHSCTANRQKLSIPRMLMLLA